MWKIEVRKNGEALGMLQFVPAWGDNEMSQVEELTDTIVKHTVEPVAGDVVETVVYDECGHEDMRIPVQY